MSGCSFFWLNMYKVWAIHKWHYQFFLTLWSFPLQCHHLFTSVHHHFFPQCFTPWWCHLWKAPMCRVSSIHSLVDTYTGASIIDITFFCELWSLDPCTNYCGKSHVKKFKNYIQIQRPQSPACIGVFLSSSKQLLATTGLSFYRSQNVLGLSKFFVPDQKFIYILWQSQIFCARQKDDWLSVKLVWLKQFGPAQNILGAVKGWCRRIYLQEVRGIFQSMTCDLFWLATPTTLQRTLIISATLGFSPKFVHFKW